MSGDSAGGTVGKRLGPKTGLVGEADGPARGGPGVRREPTERELAEAREGASRIRGLDDYGLTSAMTARIMHLPVLAVERILAERTGDPPASEVPAGAAVDPPPPTVPAGAPPPAPPMAWSGGSRALSDEELYRQLDVLDNVDGPAAQVPADPLGGPALAVEPSIALFRLLKLGGVAEPRAKLIARRYRHLPSDSWGPLRAIMVGAGLPAGQADFLLGAFREEVAGDAVPVGGEDGSGNDDSSTARLRRQLHEGLEVKLLVAQIASVERGYAPQPTAGSPELTAIRSEIESMRARNSQLEAELRDKKLLDSINDRLLPLSREIELLKSSRGSERRTLEDVQVADAEVHSKAANKSIELVAARVANAPQVLTKLDRIADTILDTPALTTKIQSTVTGIVGQAQAGPAAPSAPVSDAEYLAAAALLSAMMGEPTGAPGPEPGRPGARMTLPGGSDGTEVR